MLRKERKRETNAFCRVCEESKSNFDLRGLENVDGNCWLSANGSVLNCSEVHFWNIILKSMPILSVINVKRIIVLFLSEVRMNNSILVWKENVERQNNFFSSCWKLFH